MMARMTPQDAYAIVQQTLLPIVMESPMFDELEHDLRQGGQDEAANSLNKLIQDVGLALRQAMDVPEPGDKTAGPTTTQINESYEPVGIKRLLFTLGDILPRIENPSHVSSVEELIDSLRAGAHEFTQAQKIIEEDDAPTTSRQPDKAPRFER